MSERLRILTAFALSLPLVGLAEGGLAVAREALRDGLWEIARTHAVGSTNAAARLIVLESLAGEGKWKAVEEQLARWPDAKGAGFDYYRAVVKGDHAAVRKLLLAGGDADGVLEARLHEAEELARDGRRQEAVDIWTDVAGRTNVSARALAIASANLMDSNLLERAYAAVRTPSLRRTVGLRLGVVQMRTPATAEKGERLVRSLVRDSPDAKGARESFLAIAEAKIANSLWQEAVDTYREAVEIWPDAAKLAAVQDHLGWALLKLGRREEALEAFRAVAALPADEMTKATALLKEGDILSELGRSEESLEKYREVTQKYPKTTVAEKLRTVIRLREMEADGRKAYGEFRFAEAMKAFEGVAEEDSSRRQRMSLLCAQCLYGQGFDEKAEQKVRELSEKCPEPAVRADAMLWLAKFLYNRREWNESGRLFAACAENAGSGPRGDEAALWAARAALSNNDFAKAIQTTTRLLERSPETPCKAEALLVQGEALVEQARFDEAVLVFERVAIAEGAGAQIRQRAILLKADAFFAMGADNPSRYEMALEAYRSALQNESVTAGGRLVLAFKIARSLEKLKRLDEAVDAYYVQVVLAYRNGRLRGDRYDDEARAVFSRAAFRLADEYEGRGKDRQALNILELVATSDVPAAEEARRRIGRISNKGGFL